MILCDIGKGDAMKITFLGVHNAETNRSRLVSLLIDDSIAVDAGSLTTELSFSEQESIDTILLSHGHYDHIKNIPMFAFNNMHKTTKIYANSETNNKILTRFMDGVVYPNFTEKNSFLVNPSIELIDIKEDEVIEIGSYNIQVLRVNHDLNAIGFEIQSQDAKSIFYSGDTGKGLSHIWKRISPDILVTEMTFPNSLEKIAKNSDHLCPKFLLQELEKFHKINRYYPKIYLVHMSPKYEDTIRGEIIQISDKLKCSINIARTGETIYL